MSKLRKNLTFHTTTDLTVPEEGDMKPWVIFTQLKTGGPHIYAGWVDANSVEMATQFGIEHYGQDQVCVNIWAISRDYVGGMRMNLDASKETVAQREYQIFTQQEAGDQHFSSIIVHADCAHNAIETAKNKIPGADKLHNLWAVPYEEIHSTKADDVIWRTTDQDYRMARGYAKDVRDKWQTIRTRDDYEKYESDSLKEEF